MNKPGLILIFLLISLTGNSSFIHAQEIHRVWEEPYTEGVAAQVEGKFITYADIRRELLPILPRVREESRNEEEFQQKMDGLYQEILQSKIDNIVIVSEFIEKEYQMPSSYVTNEMDRILAEDFNNDRAAFLEHLRTQGKNIREFRSEIQEQIIVSMMRNQLTQTQAEISPERIRDFYNKNKIHFYIEEQVHLRMIMLRPMSNNPPEAIKADIDAIYKALKAGESFADLAKKYSMDSKKSVGGDWGWIKQTDLKAELSNAAFELEENEYSDPIHFGNQTFILYVEKRRDEGIQSLDDVRDKIEGILSNQLSRQAQQAWIERLRRNAFIKYY